ncbi:MAG: sigma-70 family RNA polymerase sigma factor [Planctomycetes bacterium]|nr:sigma-70 family RNA polymerase sigma factor [Planctomycetota bacterium]
MVPPTVLSDPETLLTHGDFVRALARALLDEHRAEDVVQQTWLAALERPPRAPGRLRAWLAIVAKNFAARAARSEDRRVRREQAAARPERVPSTAEVFEREAARRRVVEAVVALAEPYRSAVLLRYFENLPPREIAARLDVPVATVQTRLKRALAQLRARLDRDHGGDGRTWALVLAPLAAPAAAEGAVGGAVAGVLAMKTGTKVAAAVLLLGGSAVLWVASEPEGRGEGKSPPLLAATAPPPDRIPSYAPPTPPVQATAVEREPAAKRRPLDVPRSELRGRVLDDRGAPIRGAEVAAAGRAVASDGSGEFRLEVPGGEEREVTASHPDHFAGSATWPDGSTEPLLVVLPRRLSISGIVLDAAGSPVAGASVRAIRPEERLQYLARAALRGREAKEIARLRLVPTLALLEGRGGLTVTTLESSRNLRSMEDPFFGGAPAIAPQRFVRSEVRVRLEALVGGPRLEATSGPDGRFVLAPLPPARWQVEGDAKGGPIEGQTIDLEVSHPDLRLTVLGGRIWIGGAVRDCGTGAAIPGARVVAVARSLEARVLETAETSSPESTGAPGREEDPLSAAGSFRLALYDRSFAERPPSRLMVGLGAEGYEGIILDLDPRDGGLERLEACLARAGGESGGIEAEILFDDGERVEGPVEFKLVHPTVGEPEEVELVGDRALFPVGGAFHLEGLAAGDWFVYPRIPGQADLDWELAQIARVPAGARVRVRWTIPRGGEVVVEARNEKGEPAPEFEIRLENEARRIELHGREGRASLAGVPPGVYRIPAEVLPEGMGERSVVVRKGETTHLLLKLPQLGVDRAARG